MTIDGTPGPESAAPADWVPDDAFLPDSPRPPTRWGLGAWLFALSMLGTVAILPYSISLIRQAQDEPMPVMMVPLVVVVTLVVECGFSALAVAAGILRGERTGLGPSLFVGGASSGRAWGGVALGAILGVVLGGLIVGYTVVAPSVASASSKELTMPPLWEGFLASVGAGIREEVWLRMGLMTLLAWAAIAVARRPPGDPASIWSANALAALAFGAIHLPQAAMLIGLNTAVVGFVLVGNGIPGLVFGWLFWRRGLVAAMVSHFAMDVVLKVVLPALAE